MNKKSKQNRFKAKEKSSDAIKSSPGLSIDFCLKYIMIVSVISIVSLASIFTYDFVTQSAFFHIQKIKISGSDRALEKEILNLTNLKTGKNIFKLNLFSVEKEIADHPWIKSVSAKRDLPATIVITIVEQQPLAIVKIENLADILINTQGHPFKEYNPSKDQISDLPVISGLDLTAKNDKYLFNGPLFNSIMDVFDTQPMGRIQQIKADKNIGVIVETQDIYNKKPINKDHTLEIKLGFDNFQAKLNRAKKISEYIDKNFPEKTICSMDLFNVKKVFIKTKRNDALHNTLEKGV